jgi:Flp pilus assembly protein TadG
MTSGRRRRGVRRQAQAGVTGLEFALIALVGFVPLVFGVVQVGLAYFAVNFAAEVTRYVARTAVVCDKSAAQQAAIKANIIGFLPMVFTDDTTVSIDYGDPAACIVTLSETRPCVTVSITPGVNVPNFIPFVPVDWNLPTLRTTLTPESFASTIKDSDNCVCKHPLPTGCLTP